jgi:putative Ca2+/H+ antiporter (TMEM165/GDT1 family)
VNFAALGATFVVIFAAELPDKTMFASLVLGTRFRPRDVFLGAAGAFACHVVLAVAVGQAFTLLPRRAVDIVVAVLFLGGGLLLLLGREEAAAREGAAAGAGGTTTGGAATQVATPSPRVIATAFSVVLLAEFGDLTQITTANLAARYHDPIAVGLGALLGLWAVAGIAVLGGRALLRVVPLELVRRVAGVLMIGLAVWTAVEAIRA